MTASIALGAPLSGCAHPGAVDRSVAVPAQRGILVMAHGGSDEWNAAIRTAVAPLQETPTVVAFGMAHRDSLAHAIAQLEARGVTEVAVVRLFVSGESFRHQTEYLLGLRADPPQPLASPDDGHAPWAPIPHTLTLRLSTEGLSDAGVTGEILLERAHALSTVPEREAVLLLAHGVGDDERNRELLLALGRRAEVLRNALPFTTVRVETLREDWTGKREAAEQRIRAFVRSRRDLGERVLVIPFRVHGFGPYAEVLEGLEYVADGAGLLPHPGITAWLRTQAAAVFAHAEVPATH